MGEQRLGRARRTFEKNMATREQRDEHEIDGGILADDGLGDLASDRQGQCLHLFCRHASFSCCHL